MTLPLIGVTSCRRVDDAGSVSHCVGHKYLAAIADHARGLPIQIPAIPNAIDPERLLDRLDGLFLTGSPSNVDPSHYDGPAFRADTERDAGRDGVTLPLIRAAIKRGLPLFAVCRGHQELNVALGGSLHQHVEELPGKHDHRMRDDVPLDERYGGAHDIHIIEGGLLADINGAAGRVQVNSLHAQAIDRLAAPLKIDAMSEDNIIEAVSMPSAPGYVMSVQWHPEHPVAMQWPLSQALFSRFGAAARDYEIGKAAA